MADTGFPGTVVRVGSLGIAVGDADRGIRAVTVEAGESWDAFVARAVQEGWSGVEALSGIPGTVGAVPIQNVGAYGQEVAETLELVEVYDRGEGRTRTMSAVECAFGYRTSLFKRMPGRFVVGAVSFRLRTGDVGVPVRYAELAAALGVGVGERVPANEVRLAVLALRAAKGMVLDEGDHDTWSVGSFFTNPVLVADEVPAGAPAWPQSDGRVKTSAAWLIDRCGFGRGYGNDVVAVSGKHPLALTNRGSATTAALLALAAEIRAGVAATFGISLQPEPVLVSCSL